MKKFASTFVMAIVIISTIVAQPQAFKYQTVVRGSNGDLITNQLVRLRISFHEIYTTGPIEYQEFHNKSTNQFGLVNLEIGLGTPLINLFNDVDWSTSPKFMEIEIDTAGGTNYVSMGTSQLFSVPYALQAVNVTNNDDGDWNVFGNDIYPAVSGNVGIGTYAPISELDMAGGSIFYDTTNYDGLYFTERHTDNAGHNGSWGYFRQSTVDGDLEIGIDQNLDFYETDGRSHIMNISANLGRVGIGTTSPDKALHVSDYAGGTIKLGNGPSWYGLIEYIEGVGDLRLQAGNSSTASGSAVIFNTRDVDRVIVNGFGNVGIGTMSPAQMLHVRDANGDGAIRIGQDYNWFAEISYESSIGDLVIQSGDATTASGSDIKFNTYGVNRMIVNGYGNVGIGTMGPQCRLQVVGTTIIGTAAKGIQIRNTGLAADIESLGTYLAINYQTGQNTVMNVTSGYVGIGDASPNYKLQVNGDMCPSVHKGGDLGKNGLAWDDLYYDDLHAQGAAAFTDRCVTDEILLHPPRAKKPGDFDYMTERGLEEVNPSSLPGDLQEDNAILTDEISMYNYKANYEQQVEIERLREENKLMLRRIEALEKKLGIGSLK